MRAANLFRHAASYFGDADAQYQLARLYLDGDGVEKNVGLAINWLATAAKKQHAEAQATLGELLWRGSDDVRQRRARGLALIMLAHENAKASGKEPKWIADLYVEAQGATSAAMRKEAQNLMPGLGGHALEETATVKVEPRRRIAASGFWWNGAGLVAWGVCRGRHRDLGRQSQTAPSTGQDGRSHRLR